MPVARELLTALDFWEEYPYNLGECRVAVAMIGEHPDQVAVSFDDGNGPRLVPVNVIGIGYANAKQGWQLSLSLPKVGLICSFSHIGLLVGDSRLTRAVILTPVQCRTQIDASVNIVKEIEVSEVVLPGLHQRAEFILCPELERRGMDSSAIVVSGRVCRQVCATLEGLRSSIGIIRWPSAAHEQLNALHPTDLEAVLQAERSLIRLRMQLKLESIQLKSESEAGDNGTGDNPTATTANEDRDKWIYERCIECAKYKTIKNQLAKKAEWGSIDSPQGLKLAAQRYAERHNLPAIPSRQPGRKRAKK